MKFWFDLDNSPHVLLFRPIFDELQKRNIDYLITARSFAQTKELLDLFNMEYNLVGEHGGKNKIKKIVNLIRRSNQLRNAVKNENLSLSVSHGSRTQLLASKYLGIPSILMFDYEHTEHFLFNKFAKYLLCPKFIPDNILLGSNFDLKKIIKYNGFKEELYLKNFEPENNFREKIGITNDEILAVFRPPSMTGNYHNSKSEELLVAGLNYFTQNSNVVCLIVNRTDYERKFILDRFQGHENIRFLERPVDGLQLLFAADYAISGGGTMNREAALLGTKTYSIFTGKRPYLDSLLQEQGKLTFIENKEDFNKIEIKRDINKKSPNFRNDLAKELVEIFLEVL